MVGRFRSVFPKSPIRFQVAVALAACCWLGSGCFTALGRTAESSPWLGRLHYLVSTSPNSRLERITILPGHELEPTVSPDAQTLLFRSVEVFRGRVEKAFLQGMPLAAKTDPPVLYARDDSALTAPRWLPDGTGYVYGTLREKLPVLVRTLAPAPTAASQAIPMGAAVVAIGQDSSVEKGTEYFDIAPNGKKVVLELSVLLRKRIVESTPVRCHDRRDSKHSVSGAIIDGLLGGDTCGEKLNVREVVEADPPTIVSQALDGTDSKSFGVGREPAWSPDGNSIAFVRSGSSQRLVVVDANTGVSRGEFCDDFEVVSAPAWASDNLSLVFAGRRNSQPPVPRRVVELPSEELQAEPGRPLHLFVVRMGTGKIDQLTDGGAIVGHPRWASDGWIYFDANAEGSFDIWRLRPGAPPPPAPSVPQTVEGESR